MTSPRSQGNSSQKPQCGIPFDRAHILTLHPAHATLLGPGSVHPVHLILDGRIKASPPRRSSATAAFESASMSFLSVALRASHELQSIPQQPNIFINIHLKREKLR